MAQAPSPSQFDDSSFGKRRALYAATTIGLCVVMGLAVGDAFGWWHAYGVATATARSSGGGYSLEVRYGQVSRPALATPLEITVRRDGGLGETLVVAIDHHYLAMWDENGVVPSPASETVRGDWVEWEFEPPAGATTFTVTYDARIEPAVQWGRDGAVAVVDSGEVVTEVSFYTRVMP